MISPINRKFMRALVSYCMATWLLAVTVCGWCCHAPFVCAAELANQTSPPNSAALNDEHECACHTCKPTPTGKRTPGTPCKCPHECLGLCKTLPKPRSTIEFKLSVAALAIDAIVPLPIDSHGASFRSAGSSHLADCGPPLRLHLLHQLLLV